jgi:hypothetical protein
MLMLTSNIDTTIRRIGGTNLKKYGTLMLQKVFTMLSTALDDDKRHGIVGPPTL